MEQDNKLSGYADFFGKLVAVQTMTAVPYLVVGPKIDSKGQVVQTKQGAGLRPLPIGTQQAENLLTGVLGASADGLLLELRMQISAPSFPRDSYVRSVVRFPPGIVTFVTVLEEYVTPSSLIT